MRENLGSTERKWLFIGAIILLMSSSIVLIAESNNHWTPTPFYIIFLAWTISYTSIFVMPLLYMFELIAIQKTNNPAKTILILVIILTILNFIDIWLSWGDGKEVRTAEYIQFVFAENVIGVSIVLALSIIGYIQKKISYSYTANILLFVLLSWIAFPYLGELP